jgi:hypothetical protein
MRLDTSTVRKPRWRAVIATAAVSALVTVPSLAAAQSTPVIAL